MSQRRVWLGRGKSSEVGGSDAEKSEVEDREMKDSEVEEYETEENGQFADRN